jgi:predicted nucleic acid-binding protein
VIAVDTNILVYAHREDSPFHDAAFRRVAELAEGQAVWAIPWPCLHEFLAIVTIRGSMCRLHRSLGRSTKWTPGSGRRP